MNDNDLSSFLNKYTSNYQTPSLTRAQTAKIRRNLEKTFDKIKNKIKVRNDFKIFTGCKLTNSKTNSDFNTIVIDSKNKASFKLCSAIPKDSKLNKKYKFGLESERVFNINNINNNGIKDINTKNIRGKNKTLTHKDEKCPNLKNNFLMNQINELKIKEMYHKTVKNSRDNSSNRNRNQTLNTKMDQMSFQKLKMRGKLAKAVRENIILGQRQLELYDAKYSTGNQEIGIILSNKTCFNKNVSDDSSSSDDGRNVEYNKFKEKQKQIYKTKQNFITNKQPTFFSLYEFSRRYKDCYRTPFEILKSTFNKEEQKIVDLDPAFFKLNKPPFCGYLKELKFGLKDKLNEEEIIQKLKIKRRKEKEKQRIKFFERESCYGIRKSCELNEDNEPKIINQKKFEFISKDIKLSTHNSKKNVFKIKGGKAKLSNKNKNKNKNAIKIEVKEKGVPPKNSKKKKHDYLDSKSESEESSESSKNITENEEENISFDKSKEEEQIGQERESLRRRSVVFFDNNNEFKIADSTPEKKHKNFIRSKSRFKSLMIKSNNSLDNKKRFESFLKSENINKTNSNDKSLNKGIKGIKLSKPKVNIPKNKSVTQLEVKNDLNISKRKIVSRNKSNGNNFIGKSEEENSQTNNKTMIKNLKENRNRKSIFGKIFKFINSAVNEVKTKDKLFSELFEEYKDRRRIYLEDKNYHRNKHHNKFNDLRMQNMENQKNEKLNNIQTQNLIAQLSTEYRNKNIYNNNFMNNYLKNINKKKIFKKKI